MAPTRYFFIINPNSGTRTAQHALPKLVRELFPADTEVHYTHARGDARSLAARAAAEGVDTVVVAGGDGTINEAVQGLAHTATALAVIPLGSGNGLARSLGVPLACRAAAAHVLKSAVTAVDLGRANGEYFANVAGVGVDAQLGAAFNRSGEKGRRGMLKYFVLGVEEFLAYKPKSFSVSGDGFSFQAEPFTITAANGREYGSGAVIARHADLADGQLELICIRHVPLWRVPAALFRMFTGTMAEFGAAECRSVKTVSIKTDGELLYHIDGESRSCRCELKISIEPQALKIQC